MGTILNESEALDVSLYSLHNSPDSQNSIQYLENTFISTKILFVLIRSEIILWHISMSTNRTNCFKAYTWTFYWPFFTYPNDFPLKIVRFESVQCVRVLTYLILILIQLRRKIYVKREMSFNQHITTIGTLLIVAMLLIMGCDACGGGGGSGGDSGDGGSNSRSTSTPSPKTPRSGSSPSSLPTQEPQTSKENLNMLVH